MKEGGLQGGEERQTKKTFLGELGESMSGWVYSKVLEEDLESHGFIPSLAKPEIKRKVENKGPAHNKTERNESEILAEEVEGPQ